MTLEQQALANKMCMDFVKLKKHFVNNPDGSLSSAVKLDDVMHAWSNFAKSVAATTPFEMEAKDETNS